MTGRHSSDRRTGLDAPHGDANARELIAMTFARACMSPTPGSRTTEGTELRPAISRDLARAMRGDVVVESVIGKGSTFTLELPRG